VCCAPRSSPKTPARWRTRCGPTATCRNQQFLHRHRLRKRRRSRPHDADPGAESDPLPNGFAKGMTLYFERHDGHAVTCDDFAQAHCRCQPGLANWPPAAAVQALVQPGRHTPRTRQARVRRGCRNLHAHAGAKLRPDRRPADQAAFVIPVGLGLVGPDGQDLPLQLQGEAQAWFGTRTWC
jgi:hypothetical protein